MRQKKTGQPVRFELTEHTRQAVDDYLGFAGEKPGEFMFTGRRDTASLQRMQMDGVTYRRLKGAVRMTAPLNLASRRSDPSAVVRNFRNLVRRAAKHS